MKNRIWEFLSLVGHPLVQLPIWVALITFYNYGAIVTALIFILVIIAGSLTPYFLYRGKNSDLREIRPKILFASSLVYLLVSLIISRYIITSVGILATSAVTFIDGVISLKWKISIHATAMSGFITYAYLVLGYDVLLAIPFGLLVILSRYFLKKHTKGQLVAGTFVGFLVTIAFWNFLVR
ncbi:hypothetical protein [Sulfuracidifex tepidarius]|uniref:Phosphatidic acid phosphatase type 2/haloperoxidase domain-containing protein n=1 Tax=Sulfuracidifex tepidarius TaxID=1294262 RepID=A0A510DZ78_9CREN|nr:hypothetical protein [Sulfuracidifex tepidarius]BBG25459.1 hypothetical protein IC006_2795 [Sulfuracidifex tepidarius]BBG28253.1 hypothetical protein IC007_2809 [Sulfuracidifex tepidarius]